MKTNFAYCTAMALLFLAFNPSTKAQDGIDTPEARAAAVERYVKVMPFEQFMQDVATEMSNQVPPEQRADFLHFMTKELQFNVIESEAKKSLAKHLTLRELETLVEFMEKPEGKSAMSKMKYYMADIMPVIQQEIARAMASRNAKQTP